MRTGLDADVPTRAGERFQCTDCYVAGTECLVSAFRSVRAGTATSFRQRQEGCRARWFRGENEDNWMGCHIRGLIVIG